MAFIRCGGGGNFPASGQAYVFESGADPATQQITGQQVAFSIKSVPTFTMFNAPDYGTSGCLVNVSGYTRFGWTSVMSGNSGSARGLLQLDGNGNIISVNNYIGQDATVILDANTKYVLFVTNIYYHNSYGSVTFTVTLS